MSDDLLSEAHRIAAKDLDTYGGDFEKLSEPAKSFLLVYIAQGIIDNGTLQYFFENNWPGSPPYSVFSAAYRQIGASDSADAIDHAVELLAMDFPELNAEKRLQRMEELLQDEFGEFARLIDQLLCNNSSIWKRLTKYVEKHHTELLGR